MPRPCTGFQVKAEVIAPGKVEAEMRPNGSLRPEIRQLAEKSGAYIIVSSKSSTTHSALNERLHVMEEAVRELPYADQLKLDFYDRRRIETWLRDHPGITLWVRERVGKPIPGWQSHGNWSKMPEGARAEYLLDNQVRVRTNRQSTEPNVSALAGINAIRGHLREARGVVRLVGLSGTGKTRLAQALFDPKVGENSLDPGIVAYTDVADNPQPHPPALVAELLAASKRAILIIDNCGPDLHRQLAESCRTANSALSLMTIEYDVQDDLPEGTDVFVLEAASITLTEELARQRYPTLSAGDARRIAEFSGGNARIAIAIAGTIDKGDMIAQLSDQELFVRLFQQRHQPDEAFFTASQALSLVYSFEGENVSDAADAELSPLGALVSQRSAEMFKHSAKLKRRGLMQHRGRWRAILPPAIANRLAATALQNLPPSAIDACFLRVGRERLLKSFSRRLSYLTSGKEAHSIVSSWLARGGMLENPLELDDLKFDVFTYTAHLEPERALYAIEQALSGRK